METIQRIKKYLVFVSSIVLLPDRWLQQFFNVLTHVSKEDEK